jgi:tRNA (cytidine56-2'-O)-methyltransferase
MQGEPPVSVLRLGHRPGRDERMTTHVGLTARALGADAVILANDGSSQQGTIQDITDRFGGPFDVKTTESPGSTVRNWDGGVAHLTMYGLPVEDLQTEIRNSHATAPLLIVVGAEKVPFDVYEHADWNVGVTNQPHSEVAGLAVFLDRLFDGRELDREWEDADKTVVPKATGKRIQDTD